MIQHAYRFKVNQLVGLFMPTTGWQHTRVIGVGKEDVEVLGVPFKFFLKDGMAINGSRAFITPMTHEQFQKAKDDHHRLMLAHAVAQFTEQDVQQLQRLDKDLLLKAFTMLEDQTNVKAVKEELEDHLKNLSE